MKVKVTSYDQYLIIETVDGKKDKNFTPAGENRIGCVLTETNKYLGMSKEAFKLLKTIKKSGDDIGEVSAWKTTDGKDCFAWLGGFKKIVDIANSSGDASGIANIKYKTIKNDVPKRAMEILKENIK